MDGRGYFLVRGSLVQTGSVDEPASFWVGTEGEGIP